MRQMTPEQAAREITRAYGALGGWKHGDGVGFAAIQTMVDLTPAEITAGVRHLRRADKVSVWPESNQKVLTAADRAAAVVIGDQPKHWIAWPR